VRACVGACVHACGVGGMLFKPLVDFYDISFRLQMRFFDLINNFSAQARTLFQAEGTATPSQPSSLFLAASPRPSSAPSTLDVPPSPAGKWRGRQRGMGSRRRAGGRAGPGWRRASQKLLPRKQPFSPGRGRVPRGSSR